MFEQSKLLSDAARDYLQNNKDCLPVFGSYGGIVLCENDAAHQALDFMYFVADEFDLPVSDLDGAAAFVHAMIDLNLDAKL